MQALTLFLGLSLSASALSTAADTLNETIADEVAAVTDRVVAWRRDIHANPELSNREFRTSELVAEHLRDLGIEVQTGVAHTGVVGLLKGDKPGPVIALRADMDACQSQKKLVCPTRLRCAGNTKVGRLVSCMLVVMTTTWPF